MGLALFFSLPLVLAPSPSSDGTTTITRSVSPLGPYSPTQVVDVHLTISVGPPTECSPPDDACNDYYALEDYLPSTVTTPQLLDGAADCALSATRLACVRLDNATSTTIRYRVTLSPNPARHIWTGTYLVQGDTAPSLITGVTTIDTQAACTSAWTCDPWGPYGNGTCGTRTRTCADPAKCGTPSPSTTETLPCLGESASTPPTFAITAVSPTTVVAIALSGGLLWLLVRRRRTRR